MKRIWPGWRSMYRGGDANVGDTGPGGGLTAPSSPGARAEEGDRA